MLAVVAIFALLAAFVAPNLGLLSSRRLQQQAERISAQLELARQRAIVTGIPHRLAIDLDRGSYWLEWFVTQAEAIGEEADAAGARSARLDADLAGPAVRGSARIPAAARHVRARDRARGVAAVPGSSRRPGAASTRARPSSSSNATGRRARPRSCSPTTTATRSRSWCCRSRKPCGSTMSRIDASGRQPARSQPQASEVHQVGPRKRSAQRALGERSSSKPDSPCSR